ncbi:MAG: TonB-dependent receptor [Hyphomicrobiales bacterium]|nr:TonB-dependent receptor [Hyphomicrobiales bacterium]
MSISALRAGVSRFAVLAAAGLASVPAMAQSPEVVTTLDEITITATKQSESVVDTLAGATVFTRGDLRTQQPQRIGTIVNQAPGVSTQENANDPATAINIRGLQDFGRVAVTIDGARQNFQRSGHNANGAFFLDPAFVRAIDITRGPVANIYGSGAIGGVVSFETVDPSDILRPGERIAGELAGTGVFGRQAGWYGSAIGAARPTDTIEALAGFAFRDLNPFRDGGGNRVLDSGQELVSGLGKIVIKPGNGHELKLSGQYQTYDFANGIGTSTAPRRTNDVTTGNFAARYTFNQPGNPWLNVAATAYSTSTDTEQTRISGTPAQIGQSRFFKIRTNGVDINNTSRFDLGGGSVAVTVGADAFQDRVRTSDPSGNGDETTPSGRRSVYGGFVQSHLKYSIIDVIGALRYDGYTLDGGSNHSEGQRLSPKITVGATVIPGIQLYGSYAEGYRAPSITETLVDGLHPVPASFVFVPNPNLRPEVGKNLEAGVNIKYDDVFAQGDKLRGKVSVFRNHVRDYIDGVFVDPGAPCGSPVPGACADAFYTYENVSRARLTGVEAELVYDARTWFASLSGAHIRGDNLTNGDPLQSVYPDKIAIGGGMRFLNEKLTLGSRVTFVDEQKRLPASAVATASSAYTLVDLYGTYQFTQDSKAFLTLENVGDVRYKRFRDADFSPGFVAKIGFSTRFGS